MNLRKLGLIAAILTVGGLWMKALAVDFKAHEVVGAYTVTAYKLGGALSSGTANGLMMSWSVYTAGGTADFQIAYSTQSNDPLNVQNSASVVRSSTIFALQGVAMGDNVPSLVANPLFLVTRMDANTTFYLDITTLIPRYAGEY